MAASPTRQDLWDHVVRGEWWEPEDKPEVPADWIRELVVTGRAGDQPIHAKGVRIRGVTVTGALDFEQATLKTPLALDIIAADQPIVLTQATGAGISITASRLSEFSAHQLSLVHSLDLSGTQVAGPVLLSSAGVKGDIYLDNGFEAEGEVRLLGATIGGSLSCSHGTFYNPDKTAFGADGMEVTGSVFLRDGFEAEGEVRLRGATIGGSLDCGQGRFHNPKKDALSADGMKVTGSVFLDDGFEAEGEVRLPGATIGGVLSCVQGKFHNPEKNALSADGMKVAGSVFLGNGFEAEGEVSLIGARIGSALDCSHGTFYNPEKTAFGADRMKVAGSVFLRDGFEAEGEVRLPGATIGGSLDCSQGRFHNPEKDALSADRMEVTGGVFLGNGFEAEGVVRLPGATIGGNFDCSDGKFHNPEKDALIADGMKVTGSVFLGDGFEAEGVVRLLNATIDGQVGCVGGSFQAPGKTGLNLQGASGGPFFWRAVNVGETTAVDVRLATVGSLSDDSASWLAGGAHFLDGFTYSDLAPDAFTDPVARIRWIQTDPNYHPQPYEQLVAVYRKNGQDKPARKVAIAKQKARRRSGQVPWWQKPFHWGFGFIGYGHRPYNAIWALLAIITIGWWSFAGARTADVMAPTRSDTAVASECTPGYPCLEPLVYSIDVTIPIINLEQRVYWLPDTSTTQGLWVQILMWVFIAAGWGLSTLFVAAVTGLVRRD